LLLEGQATLKLSLDIADRRRWVFEGSHRKPSQI
jgi:hypothetical protein